MQQILESVMPYLQIAGEFLKSYWPFLLATPFVWVIGWKLLFFTLEMGYNFLFAGKRTYIMITLPREESQKDKENAVEKDFREKIGVMEQLYRGLHEIRELSLYNRIIVWLFQRHDISFEIHAQFKEVSFYASIDPYYADVLEKQITSYYPSADIQYVKPPEIKSKEVKTSSKFYYMFLKRNNFFPIQTFKKIENDPLNDFTNVFSKLQENEKAFIQLMVRPNSGKWQKQAIDYATALFKGRKPGSGRLGFLSVFAFPFKAVLWIFTAFFWGVDKADKSYSGPEAKQGDSYVRMLSTEEEVAKGIGEKAGQVGFDAVIRVGAASDKGEWRTDEILNGIFVSFNSLKNAASNWFESRRIILLDFINTPILRFCMERRIFRLLEKESILNPEEMASVFHFPSTRYNNSPVIKWMAYKVLPLPSDAGTEGIILGNNVYRGVKKPVYFAKRDRSRHHYIIGQTGTGKSAYISYLARQDIQNGDGVCVIDPHGDLIEDILQYVPKERAKDVVIFDPSNMERPMGLNMLEAKTPEQQDMASSQATEIFIKIFGDEIFGPRIQHYFRNACLTLMEDPDEGATLIDVPRIFVDEAFMKHKVSKVKNPVVKSFWEHEYANTGDRERQEMIPYFSAKFGPFVTNSIMRNTIGQSKSAFNFREVMDQKKILLVNLSKGKLGTLNTQLLGLVMVAQIQMAAMSRVDTPEDDRKDFFLYVDEFQNFATDTFCSILSEARKYRLNLIMAHQYINQLVVSKFGNTSSQIRDAVFGNVGTLQSFKVGAEDAEYLAKEFAPVLTEQDIIGIANYKAYIKLNIHNATSRPFSLETIYDTTGKNPALRDKIRQYSSLRYGRKKEFVDQEIAARIGVKVSELSQNTTAAPEVPTTETAESQAAVPTTANPDTTKSPSST